MHDHRQIQLITLTAVLHKKREILTLLVLLSIQDLYLFLVCLSHDLQSIIGYLSVNDYVNLSLGVGLQHANTWVDMKPIGC